MTALPPTCPPDGPLSARLAYVGARPGRDEVFGPVRKGFIGQSGQLLWRLSKIPRSECYVTNVRKDYSAQHDTPTRAEIHEALPDLQRELSGVDANVFVAIGGDALYALTGKTSVEKWRGSVLESTLLPGRKVIATWHTAAALRTYNLRYVIDLDLRRALRESAYPEIRRPQRTFHINPPLEEAVNLLRGLGNPVACDIETLGDQVSCLALSDNPNRAVCIAFFGGPYSQSELAVLWRELDIVLRTKELEGQNFQFDTTRLERLGFKIGRIGFDTMLAHHLLWTELGSGFKRKQGDYGIDSLTGKHSLAFISSVYTDEPYYKDQSNEAWNWSRPIDLGQRLQEYWEYNCLVDDTPVLMADLSWKKLIDVQIGDKVLTTEEEPSGSRYQRKLIEATVTNKLIKEASCIKVTFDNYESLSGTPDHKILSKKIGVDTTWTELGKLDPNSRAFHICKYRRLQDDFETGWMSGLYDGEGCLELHNANFGAVNPMLAFSQNEGLILDKAVNILDKCGFKIRRKNHPKGTQYIWIAGGFTETLEALILFKPIRIIDKFRKSAQEIGIGGLAQTSRPKPIKTIYEGRRTVVDITTTAGTFIANGFVVHNCKDACVTREAAIKMRVELERYGQTKYFHEHVMSLIRPIMNIQSRGMCVDDEELERVRRRQKLECDCLQAEFNHLIGWECNVYSPIHLKQLIFKQLGIRSVKLTKTGRDSLDKDTLLSLAYKGEHPDIFRRILDIRERRTSLSGFLNMQVNDGKYQTAFLIHGTDSGRLSGRAVGKGPQPQNIPKPTRKVFVPARGSCYVQGDLRRAEAMHVAYRSGAKRLIALFEDPTRDLYKEVAAQSLGWSIEDVLNPSRERDVFKQVVLGSNYIMGPLKLVGVLRVKGIDIMKLPIPGSSGKAKAEYVQGAYFHQFPEILQWHKDIEDEVRRTRSLTSTLGRRRMFLDRMDAPLFRAACSFDPQATIVGIANRAIRLLDAQGWHILTQVHDSILIECETKRRDEAAIALQDAMTYPIVVNGRVMTIPVDMQWSEKSWGHMDEWRQAT